MHYHQQVDLAGHHQWKKPASTDHWASNQTRAHPVKAYELPRPLFEGRFYAHIRTEASNVTPQQMLRT